MILIVLDSKETLVECVFDILEIIRDGCILGEPIHQRPVLPGPAPPRRPAVRRPDSIRSRYLCSGVEFDRLYRFNSCGMMSNFRETEKLVVF